MRLYHKGMLVVVALSLAPSWTTADVLGVAGNYNAVAFANLTLFNGSSQGALAAGGIVPPPDYTASSEFDNFNVATSLTSGTNLVVGNGLSFGDANINGDVAATGPITMYNASVTGQVYYNDQADYDGVDNSTYEPSLQLPVDFATLETQLTNTSDCLSMLTPTGSTTDLAGAVVFTGTVIGQNVFTIDMAQLTKATSINIVLPPGATAIINVTNVTNVNAALPNATFLIDHAIAGNITWNFNGFGGLALSGPTDPDEGTPDGPPSTFEGSILAPTADLAFSNAALDGTIVAQSLTANYSTFDTPQGSSLITISAPLPESFLGGLCLFGGLWISRRITSRPNR
jgi:choice-of-anchor A domain-containing protein